MISGQKITNVEKAAIVLRYIGEEAAGKVLERFSESEIKKIAYQMSKMEHIPPELLKPVIEEFVGLVSSKKGTLWAGSKYVQKMLTSALGKEKAGSILNELLKTDQVEAINKLRSMDPRSICVMCRNEHPQTIALILSHLDSTRSADVIALLPESIQTDVVVRMCNLEGVHPDILEDVAEAIHGEMSMMGEVSKTLGGVKCVADILNLMGRTTEEKIMTQIEEQNQPLSQEIKQLMFVFDDLAKIDDRGIRELLKTVNTQELAKALKIADEAVKEKIFKNMSTRAAEMLKEEMEMLGPTRLSEVEQAQQEVVTIALSLKAAGKIAVLEGKGDVLV